MAQDTITILGFDIKTQDAVKNVADLKDNIKILKQVLDDENASQEENAKAAELLRQNQYALRDAMYSTASSAKDLESQSQKLLTKNGDLNGSYNELVHTMAELKSVWRSTTNEIERENIGKEIDRINTQLKQMDASVGNYSRNVGDYANSIKSVVRDIPRYADPLKKVMKDVSDQMGVMSKQPLLGIITLLYPVIMQITDSLKESDDAMGAINKVMTAMKPIMAFMQNILEKVVGVLTDIIGKVAEFVTNNGLFSKIIDGCVGVGNAIVQFIVAPFKGVVAAIKVFQEEGIKGFRNASKAFATEMKSGVAFKKNFEAGQSIAQTLVSGIKDKKSEVEKAGTQAGEDFATAFEKVLAQKEQMWEARRKMLQDEQKALDDMVQADMDAMNAEIENFFAEEEELMKRQEILQEMAAEADRKRNEEAEKNAQARIEMMFSIADATASVLSTIADMYEADEKNAEKNAKKIKALRVATATIDTISGAVGAFMQATETIPPPYGIIIGAVQAAAVTAAGIAQIAKMKSTNISGGATSAPSAPAVTSAPVMSMEVPNVRNVTSASEEDRLNQMAGDQRVVLVMSDLETRQNQSRVQVAETSF